MKALAIFRDKPDDKGWRLLKKGFRHVLVAVEVFEGTVVIVDPAGGGLHLWAGAANLGETGDHYRGIGATVVECEADPKGNLYPSRWTCVEVAKRVLGIRGLILTPYQLYRRLT